MKASIIVSVIPNLPPSPPSRPPLTKTGTNLVAEIAPIDKFGSPLLT